MTLFQKNRQLDHSATIPKFKFLIVANYVLNVGSTIRLQRLEIEVTC